MFVRRQGQAQVQVFSASNQSATTLAQAKLVIVMVVSVILAVVRGVILMIPVAFMHLQPCW